VGSGFLCGISAEMNTSKPPSKAAGRGSAEVGPG
jgi:hypothetical protein